MQKTSYIKTKGLGHAQKGRNDTHRDTVTWHILYYTHICTLTIYVTEIYIFHPHTIYILVSISCGIVFSTYLIVGPIIGLFCFVSINCYLGKY